MYFLHLWLILRTVFFFFFQAEDGIRDGHVTGVQTCALPISRPHSRGRPSAYSARQGSTAPHWASQATRHANRSRPSPHSRAPISTSTTAAPPTCGRWPPPPENDSSSSPGDDSAAAIAVPSAPPHAPPLPASRAATHCPAC